MKKNFLFIFFILNLMNNVIVKASYDATKDLPVTIQVQKGVVLSVKGKYNFGNKFIRKNEEAVSTPTTMTLVTKGDETKAIFYIEKEVVLTGRKNKKKITVKFRFQNGGSPNGNFIRFDANLAGNPKTASVLSEATYRFLGTELPDYYTGVVTLKAIAM